MPDSGSESAVNAMLDSTVVAETGPKIGPEYPELGCRTAECELILLAVALARELIKFFRAARNVLDISGHGHLRSHSISRMGKSPLGLARINRPTSGLG